MNVSGRSKQKPRECFHAQLGAVLGEEEAVLCTEQHRAPLRTFFNTAVQEMLSHPDRAEENM